MASCLLLQADEAVWAGDKAAEGRLKGLITSETQMIESKGVDSIRMRNFLRVIMTSNEGWVVPAGMDERRYVILDVNPRCAQNRAYFAEMDEELNNGGRERLLHDLLTFNLRQVDLWHLPQTEALLEQKIRSLDTIDDFWYNRLHEGDSWPTVIVCDQLHAEYLKAASQIGVGRKRGPAEFGKRLAKLVPEMRKVRPAIEVEPGVTKRAWCYELPSLDECRAAFDKLVGQPVDWPAPSPGEGGRAQHSGMDDYSSSLSAVQARPSCGKFNLANKIGHRSKVSKESKHSLRARARKRALRLIGCGFDFITTSKLLGLLGHHRPVAAAQGFLEFSLARTG